MNLLPDTPTYHFFTLVTKDDQYDAMRQSLARAGFDESNSVFSLLDNRASNAHEPYSAINEALLAAKAPYVVFCHQDLVFLHGPEALQAALDGVEAIDPTWSVAGNAGLGPNFDHAFCVDDHVGSQDLGARPARVLTLDENFLVIRPGFGVGCSPELSGFHLYGTDLCLNAYRNGRSAYVIEYRLRHEGGAQDYRGLERFSLRFARAWRKRVRGAVLVTPSTAIVLAPVPWLYDALVRSGIVRRFLFYRLRELRAINRRLYRWRPDWLPRG